MFPGPRERGFVCGPLARWDREEILEAGDAYYLEPGQNLIVGDDGEIVEFSPAGAYQKTMAAVADNTQAAPAVQG